MCAYRKSRDAGRTRIIRVIKFLSAPHQLSVQFLLYCSTGTLRYYFEKIPKNDTRVLLTESKETPDLDQHRMQQELTQNNPRHPILNTK